MEICVFGPSETYARSAGARIRYSRLQKWLKPLGHSLHVRPLSDVKPSLIKAADVILFSKCYDVRAVAIARALRGSDALIGVDFFDDVFSQSHEPRLLHWRRWARQMAADTDFALCSTPRMQDVAARYLPRDSCHLLNDPFERFAPLALGSLLQAKVDHARTERRIKVGWFGQGDNPRYPVGLRDLAAFGESLQRLAGRGWAVHLTILTARKSLTAEGLEQLRRLSVPHVVHEWSLEAEERLLRDALVAYIPVNSQPFSAAKSLNRAVSALTHGAQVLSDGHPLYEPFGDLIYSRAEDLADDLEGGALRLRAASLPALVEHMTEWGDPAIEAARLSGFLNGRKLHKAARAPGAPPRPMAILHGLESDKASNIMTRRLGCLSVASPLSRPGRNYDVAFMVEDETVRLDINPDARPHLAPAFQADLTPSTNAKGEPRLQLDLCRVLAPDMLQSLTVSDDMHPLRRRMEYRAAMTAMLQLTRRMLPEMDVILSEIDPIAAGLGPDSDNAGAIA